MLFLLRKCVPFSTLLPSSFKIFSGFEHFYSGGYRCGLFLLGVIKLLECYVMSLVIVRNSEGWTLRIPLFHSLSYPIRTFHHQPCVLTSFLFSSFLVIFMFSMDLFLLTYLLLHQSFPQLCLICWYLIYWILNFSYIIFYFYNFYLFFVLNYAKILHLVYFLEHVTQLLGSYLEPYVGIILNIGFSFSLDFQPFGLPS